MKNRSNIAASILQNGDMLRSVYEDAQNSNGSAETELNSYLDSIDGKIAQLQNRAQEFWYTAIDQEVVKTGIGLASDFLSVINNIVKSIGLIPSLAAAAGAALSLRNDFGFIQKDIDSNGKLVNKIPIVDGIKGVFESGKIPNPIEYLSQKETFDLDNILSSNEMASVNKFNELIKAGKTGAEAMGEAMGNASDRVKSLAQNAGDAEIQTKGLEGSTKGAELATNLLSSAATGLAAALASWVASKVIEGINNYIQRVKLAKEALDEAKSTYENLSTEIEETNSQLEDCDKRIREINALPSLTISEQEELERLQAERQELENILAIKQAEQKISAKDVFDKANNYYAKKFDAGTDENTIITKDQYNSFASVKDLNPRNQMDELIAKYKELNSSKSKYEEDLLNISQKLNNSSSSLSDKEYSKLVSERDRIQADLSEAELDIKDTQSKMVDLYNTVKDVSDGYSIYTNAGYLLTDTQQKVSDSCQVAISSYTEWAKTLNETTDGAKEATKAFQTLTKTSTEMSTLSEEVSDTVSALNSVNTALQGQVTGQSITLTESLSQYASCLEYTNGVMQLNAEKTLELSRAKAEEKIATLEADEAQERYQYNLNAAKIDEYTTALNGKDSALLNGVRITQEMVSELRKDNEQIVLNSKNYKLMESQIREATGAYQEWINSQNASTQGTMFTDAGNAWKALYEGLQNGKVGTEKFKAALSFIVPDDIDSENKTALDAYLTKLKRYLDDNGSGVSNFINDAVKQGLMTGSAEDGADIVKGTKISDFVEKLGVTEELVRGIFGELETYGYDFDWSLEGLDSVDDALFEAKTKYDDLRTDMEQNGLTVTINQDDINKAGKALEQLSRYGNVDLTNRKKISGKTMREKGWSDFTDDDIATTYTASDFVWQGDEDTGKYVYVHYTPILPNGDVLSPDELSKYINETLSGTDDILKADSKGIIMKVDDGISREDSVNYRNTGELSSAMNRIIQQGNSWDEKVHEYQATFYNVVDQDLQKLNDEYGQTSKQFKELAQQRADMFNESYSSGDFQNLRDEYDLVKQAAQLQNQISKGTYNGDELDILTRQYEYLRNELSETYGVDISTDSASQVLQDLQQQMITISGLTSFNVDIVADQAKQELQSLKDELQTLQDELAKVDNSLVGADGDKYLDLASQREELLRQIEEKQSQIKDKEEEVDWITTLKVKLDDSVAEAEAKKEELGKDVDFDVNANTQKAIEKINEVRDLLSGLGATVTLEDPLPKVNTSSKSTASGTAHASGSNGKTTRTETALIGELGREIVVNPRTGKWRTYGDNGAEFATIPSGSIVFDAEQSKALLERGFVNERGTAYASGTAHAFNNIGSVSNTKRGKIVSSGTSSLDEIVNSANKTATAADKAAKATDNLTNSTKNAADAESNLVDWIDRRITLLDNQASLLAKKSSDAYMSYFGMTEEQFELISSLMSDPTNVENYGEGLKRLSEISQATGKSMDELYETIKSGNFEESRLSANAAQLEINAEKINTLTAAVEQYRAKYEEYMATISQDYRSKIESGALTLENFESETSSDDNSSQNSSLYDNIQKAIEYYDKVKSSETSLYDTQQEHLTLLEEKHNLYIGKLEKENTLLQTQADLTQKSIDLATAVGEIVSADSYESLISNNKQQQSNIRKQISAKQDKLDELDPEIDTEEYYTLENEILEAKGNLLDLKKAQAEYNKKLKEMPITNMSTIISMYKDISTAIQNWGAEIEAAGTALTADYYQELIKNGSTIVSEYQKQAGIIQDVMDTYDVGSDNWNELYSQLQSVNSEMSSMIQNLKKWNEELLQLPLTKITNYSSDLTKVKDALTELQDDYTTVISAVTSAIEDETKAIQEQQEEYQKAIKEQTDALQDKIDLLEKQNTKLQLQQSLEQALYDLQTANTQKTEKVIRNGEIVYETNTDNIREAQKSVQDAQYNITKNQLQEQIDALNDQLDEYNDKVDEQLDALDKIKEKWSEIAENVTKAQNALVADQYIGTGWKDKVLSGNDNDIYTAFKNQYEVNAAQIKKYEEQINSTEKIQTLLNEYITAYKEGQISYDAAQSAIQGLLSQLNQTMTASANISNVMAYEKLLNNASGTNSEEILKSIQGNLSESGLTLLKSLEQYKNNQSLISSQTSTWEQLNNNVAEMLSVLKDVRTALKNTERDDDDDDSSSSKSSKNTSKSGGPGKSSWSNVDENNGPGAEINRKKAGLAHSGLEAGVVGGATSSDKTTQLKWLGLRELDPDEYPYILRAGEQVINEDQRKTLLSNLNNMFDIGSRNSLAVASKITGNNSTSSPNVNVQIDKIVMPDVTDADGFAKSLYNNLELSFSQQFSKLR